MAEKETIKVLIVDDIAETRDNIRRSLEFDKTIEVIGTASNGKEAITLAIELKPDVVIMDINMPDMDGITATETIRQKVPFIQVIILSVQSDPSYMRKAMLVGARDFLTKPPSIDELIAAIRRAGNMAKDEQLKLAKQSTAVSGPSLVSGQSGLSGKIITIYSPKGGVGKTTIATNLSLALLEGDNKVVLVDSNMQFGDAPIFFNEQIKNGILDLTPRVDELDLEILDSVLIKHAGSDLKILAAPPRPEQAETVNCEQFGKLLEYLKQVFQFIVVDTSSYLTEYVQSALDASEIIVLITTQEIPAIKNTSLFLNLVDAFGINRERILLIINRFDKRISISPEKISKYLHQVIIASFLFEERMISSINRGIPFFLEAKTEPLGINFSSFADIIKERIIKLDSAI
jgi:pilus assembly protein CpaE